MFHHQKSSKSSDENLQINLLDEKERDSRIDFIRPQQKNIKLNKHKRTSENLNYLFELQVDKNSEPNPYDKISVVNQTDFSISMLTNTNQNNSIVGFILYLLLISLTNTQTLVLCAAQSQLEIMNLVPMVFFVSASQIAAFVTLYYFKWVQSFSIFFQYIKIRPRQNISKNSILAKIILRPYLFIPLVLFLTSAWQFSYCYILIHNFQIVHHILFFTIILPEIAVSLYLQEELHQNKRYLIAFYSLFIYLIIMACYLADIFLVIASLIGTLLVYFNVRVGRVCLFIQYFAKILIMGGSILFLVFNKNKENDFYPSFLIPQDDNPGPSIVKIVFLLIVSALSIIIVRCLNNKILRTELYKYLYTDYYVNNGLLVLPMAISYVYNNEIDFSVSILGCLGLFVISFLINKSKQLTLNENHVGNQQDNK